MAIRKTSASTQAKREAAKAKALAKKEEAKFKKMTAARKQLVSIEVAIQKLEARRVKSNQAFNEAENKLRKRWETVRAKAG